METTWLCPKCGYRAEEHNRGQSCATMLALRPKTMDDVIHAWTTWFVHGRRGI
jgi:hypothetical protein